jgi:hypothetical protein
MANDQFPKFLPVPPQPEPQQPGPQFPSFPAGGSGSVQGFPVGNAVNLIKIDDQVISSAVASLRIPKSGNLGIFTEIWVKWVLRGDTAASFTELLWTVNGVGSNNYLSQRLQGSGATASAAEGIPLVARWGNVFCAAATAPAGYVGFGTLEIPNPNDVVVGAINRWGMFVSTVATGGFSDQTTHEFTLGPMQNMLITPAAGNLILGRVRTYGMNN